jgi:hypothetical protein
MCFFKGQELVSKKFKSKKIYEVITVHRDGTYTVGTHFLFENKRRLTNEEIEKEFDDYNDFCYKAKNERATIK